MASWFPNIFNPANWFPTKWFPGTADIYETLTIEATSNVDINDFVDIVEQLEISASAKVVVISREEQLEISARAVVEIIYTISRRLLPFEPEEPSDLLDCDIGSPVLKGRGTPDASPTTADISFQVGNPVLKGRKRLVQKTPGDVLDKKFGGIDVS